MTYEESNKDYKSFYTDGRFEKFYKDVLFTPITNEFKEYEKRLNVSVIDSMDSDWYQAYILLNLFIEKLNKFKKEYGYGSEYCYPLCLEPETILIIYLMLQNKFGYNKITLSYFNENEKEEEVNLFNKCKRYRGIPFTYEQLSADLSEKCKWFFITYKK